MPGSQIELTFLGTGTSHGIPVPGCACAVCVSSNPKNKRFRASVLLRWMNKTILVDMATEFRLQAIACDIKKIDAILVTHDHADHLHGIDDIRSYSSEALPLYARAETLDSIRKRFDYIFKNHDEGGGVPRLNLIPVRGSFLIGDCTVIPVPLLHGSGKVLGFRFGNIAYCTDCNAIPDESKKLLMNLEVLILDGLRHETHSTHFSIGEALREISVLKPKTAYLTHLCHRVDHEALSRNLPDNVFAPYDGLKILS
jgi:phosphoribosyl 1,2-cyclic phosphate phosphodiesterase